MHTGTGKTWVLSSPGSYPMGKTLTGTGRDEAGLEVDLPPIDKGTVE